MLESSVITTIFMIRIRRNKLFLEKITSLLLEYWCHICCWVHSKNRWSNFSDTCWKSCFSDIFRQFWQFMFGLTPVRSLQSVTKVMGKADIWVISCFYSLPPLNNVEKTRVKLASSYVVRSQHCIEGEQDF